ncbi:hypothetical protein NMY22_g12751 [Coprinellus aureogranulatus]|nr:hypothetical protein NMY22_g12751 [Coprinellus aureogranulatus]
MGNQTPHYPTLLLPFPEMPSEIHARNLPSAITRRERTRASALESQPAGLEHRWTWHGYPQNSSQSHPQSSGRSRTGARPGGTLAAIPQARMTVPVHDLSNHHYGNTYNTTNTASGSGPAYFINHVENASFRTRTSSDLLLLNGLLPKHPEVMDARNNYLPDSRLHEERLVADWADNPAGELVLCIHGGAGMGKTTLARRIQLEYRSRNRLAAAVFLTALQGDLRKPESVVQIIAGELGRMHTKACSSIVAAVHRCHGAPLHTQLQKLIVDPLRSLALGRPLIAVMDGTDELPSHHLFLEALTCLNRHSDFIRFLVLGRLEPRGKAFRHLSAKSHLLHPVSRTVMESYINRRFDGVEWGPGMRPRSRDVARLAEKASGLFIWTATACSLIEDRLNPLSPRDTISAILSSRRGSGGSGDMGQLYRRAIVLLFPTPEHQETAQKFLGAIMVLQEPLPLRAFSTLVGMRTSVIEKLQQDLSALMIRRPFDWQSMVYPARTVCHLSFVEFLEVSPAHSASGILIRLSDSHSSLAEACLEELIRFLPTSQDLDFLDLSEIRLYAIKFWAFHISRGSPSVEPRSSAEWQGTRVCSLLDKIPIDALYQWAVLLLPFGPDFTLAMHTYSNGDKGNLLRFVGGALCKPDASPSTLGISCFDVAVRLQPNDEDAWIALGAAHLALASIEGLKDAADQAVAAFRNFRCSSGNDPCSLPALCRALCARSQSSSTPKDLDESISLLRSALQLPDLALENGSLAEELLYLLACSLYFRSLVTNSLCDVQESVGMSQKTVMLGPPVHLDRSRAKFLYIFASAIHRRAIVSQSNDDSDLNEAIGLYRQLIEYCPPGDSSRADYLHSLSEALCDSLSRSTSHDEAREAEALSLVREAMSLDPFSPGLYPEILLVFSRLILRRHERDSGLVSEELVEAYSLCCDAVSSCTPDHPLLSVFAELESKLAALQSDVYTVA